LNEMIPKPNAVEASKHWTDWVDYWAVDFDCMQRKEIIKVAVGFGTWWGRFIAGICRRNVKWRCRNMRNAGPEATFGKASVPVRTENLS
jgi:hypothetical protein